MLCVAFWVAFSVYDPFAQLRPDGYPQRAEVSDAPVARATIVPIAPSAQEDQTDPVWATLYFRYANTGYLGQEACILSVPRDSTMEKAIVSALIDGPDGTNGALTSVFRPKERRQSRIVRLAGCGLCRVCVLGRKPAEKDAVRDAGCRTGRQRRACLLYTSRCV